MRVRVDVQVVIEAETSQEIAQKVNELRIDCKAYGQVAKFSEMGLPGKSRKKQEKAERTQDQGDGSPEESAEAMERAAEVNDEAAGVA